MSNSGARSVGSIDAPALKARLVAGEALVLLDVREQDERGLCSIEARDAVVDLHVPLAQVPQRLSVIREVAAGRPVVVYCHHGVRSLMVARWLATQGVAGVLNLEGGIDAWSLEVDASVPRY